MRGLNYILLTGLTAMIIFQAAFSFNTAQQMYSNNADKNYIQSDGHSGSFYQNLAAGSSSFSTNKIVSKSNIFSNPNFILLDNQSRLVSSGLPIWIDRLMSCEKSYKCASASSTGWKDKTSLRISTTSNTKNTWSSIYGKEIGVNPKERYELVTHMKLNSVATNSHIGIQGFNETSNKWKQFKQCPPGIIGSLEWRQFSCEVTIPEGISKIRPILNAGWSSLENEEAVTFFDDIYMIRLTDVNFVRDVPTIINDPNLKTEVVTRGLELPISMTFLGPDDILVLEKNKGTVQRIINGTMLPEPLIDLNVGNVRERGLLGIAIASKNENGDRNRTTSNTTNTTHVFLYLTESKDGDNDTPEPLSNRLYRYDLENNRLVNPKLLLELPLTPKTIHNGGVVAIGPDNNVYTVVGDLDGITNYSSTKAENYRDGPEPDGRAGVLRMTQNGQLVNGTGILGDDHPLDKYYAYGIRNSFGMDFDPITGNLWDTENGASYGDEINLVEPGFNSGWQVVQGHWKEGGVARDIAQIPDDLVGFDGKGKYSDPEYEWSETVSPTALKFLNTDKLGREYENDMFVGDYNNGNIYHFELNKDRTKLNLDSAPEARLNEKIIFAKGFGGVTDIEVGPDGYLYIVSINQGKIYRIVPNF
jgi:glucose/arabinose dehydrogenase